MNWPRFTAIAIILIPVVWFGVNKYGVKGLAVGVARNAVYVSVTIAMALVIMSLIAMLLLGKWPWSMNG